MPQPQTNWQRIQQIQAEQGWSNTFLGDLALMWMREHDHEEDLLGRCQEVARDENDCFADKEGE